MGHHPPCGAWPTVGLMVTNAGRPRIKFGVRVSSRLSAVFSRSHDLTPSVSLGLGVKLRGSEPSSQRGATGRASWREDHREDAGAWGSYCQTRRMGRTH